MTDFVEWNPKHHGHKPPYWKPDMLTSVDGKNFARQPNWAWIAGSIYYVPPEAVGVVREAVEEETDEQHTGLTSLYYKGRDGVLREVVRVSAKEFAELKHNLQGIPTVYAVWPEEDKQP